MRVPRNQYFEFDHAERFALLLKAVHRQDWDEVEKLQETAPYVAAVTWDADYERYLDRGKAVAHFVREWILDAAVDPPRP